MTAELFPTTTRKQPRAKVLPKVAPKSVAVPVSQPLTAAQLREAARNVKTLQDARAAWKLGDQRDAENPCKHCGFGRVEIMTDVTTREVREQRAKAGDPRIDIAWDVRCLVCRPMEET